MIQIAHFIDNAHVPGTSGRSQPVFNPATGGTEKTVALASPAEVDRAVSAAAAAWPKWAKTPSLRRTLRLSAMKQLSGMVSTGGGARQRLCSFPGSLVIESTLRSIALACNRQSVLTY